jgi:integrase
MTTERRRARAPEPKKDPRSGTWLFTFDSRHPNADGSRRQVKRRGFTTERAAKAALREELDRDATLTERDDGLTVAHVLDQLIRSKTLAGKAPATVHQYEWVATRAKARFGTMPADKLTADHLDAAYLAWLADGLSARSVGIMHKAIKASYAFAVDRGQVVRNPARFATAPGAVQSTRPYWTPAQVGVFLDHATVREAGRGHYHLPCGLVELMADTGARRGELLGLAWSEVDLDTGTVSIVRQLVPDPKTAALSIRPTKRPRAKATIGLHPSTVDALKARRRVQIEDRLAMGAGWPSEGLAVDLVFTWGDGSPIAPAVLSRTIARMATEAGLPRLTAHGLRHSFATAALLARVPVEVVAARLGNTARVVQETYMHVIPADDQAAAQLVGDLYRRPAVASTGSV